MTGWSIKGDAGAGIDATERLLSTLNIAGASLTHASLESDLFEWSAQCADPAASGTLLPTLGQLIEVFHNGTRRFRGHTASTRITDYTLSVTCEGPWWWMKKIMLTSEQADGTGTTTARASYVFPTQDLKTSITALLQSAITAGVPMVIGTIDDMFAFPRITLSETSYAQALADLLSVVPDAVAWFSYTAAGLPAINVSRRAAMAALTHTLGTEDKETIDLTPRLDLEVSKIEIKSVIRRSTDGKTQWVTESAGTSATGKNQIMLVSGPEINAFLPRDRFDSFQCQTLALPTTTSFPTAFSNYIQANDPALATIKREYGAAATIMYTQEYIVAGYSNGQMGGGTAINVTSPALHSKKSTAGLYMVISPDRVPEWAAEENGHTIVDATLNGWAMVQIYGNGYNAVPPHWEEISRLATTAIVGYPVGTTGVYRWFTYFAFFNFSLPVQLINRKIAGQFSTLTTVHRQWDYDYVTPPTGLASHLLSAQNWIPWEGRITTVHQDVDGSSLLHKKHHVSGTLAECATMGALARSIVHDIPSGRRTINLGSPARTDFGTLSDKFRRHPKDNIIIL